MFNQNGTISGVTTAAVIWILAAIGSLAHWLIGSLASLGYTLTPVLLALLTVTVLTTCTSLEKIFSWLQRGGYKNDIHSDDKE